MEIKADEVSEIEKDKNGLETPLTFQEFVAEDEVLRSDHDIENSDWSKPPCIRKNSCEDWFQFCSRQAKIF